MNARLREELNIGNETAQSYNNNPGTPDKPQPAKTPHYYSFTQESEYPSHYYLELYDDPKAKPIDTVLCPLVNTLKEVQPLSVARTWVFDGTPYEEHSGFAQRTFVLSGRSGFSFTALSRFAKFRNFLEKYARLSAENKNAFERLKDVRLALNFPWEGESFWCTVLDFQYQRSIATSRLSYEYQITLVTNGVASCRWQPNDALNYVNCDKGDGCHTDPRHFCQSEARKEVTLAPSDVADVIGASDPRLPKLFKLAESTAQGPASAGSFSPSHFQRMWAEADACFNAIYLRYRELPEPLRTDARASVVVMSRWLLDLKIQCEIELGSRGFRVGLSVDLSTVDDLSRPRPIADRGQLVRLVTVGRSDYTAADIAGRYLGDRNLWVQIVRLNGMIDSRTKNDGSPLTESDQLKIPVASGVPFYGDVYGTNFAIIDGDLVVEGDTRIVLVSGFDNFYQNLKHRLMTTRGRNKAYPNFGLPELIGTVETSDVPGQVLSNVRHQVLADHRVKSLLELSLEEEPGKLEVDFTVETVTDDKVPRKFDYPI